MGRPSRPPDASGRDARFHSIVDSRNPSGYRYIAALAPQGGSMVHRRWCTRDPTAPAGSLQGSARWHCWRQRRAPEYQLLDDAAHPDGKNRLTSAGAAYALYPSPEGVVKPAGEWNSTLVVVQGARVQHWMNGQKLLEYELWSPDWEAKVKASKFVDWPNYGRAKSGYIGIQGDHDGELTLRNVRIRTIP